MNKFAMTFLSLISLNLQSTAPFTDSWEEMKKRDIEASSVKDPTIIIIPAPRRIDKK